MRRKKWFRRRARVIIKTLTYKILSTLTTFIVGWLLTGSLAVGLTLGVVEITLKVLLFYLHEEAWVAYDRSNKKKKKRKNKKNNKNGKRIK